MSKKLANLEIFTDYATTLHTIHEMEQRLSQGTSPNTQLSINVKLHRRTASKERRRAMIAMAHAASDYEEPKNRGYIYSPIARASKNQLKTVLKGIPALSEIDTAHMTLMYSKRPTEMQIMPDIDIYLMHVDSVAVMGDIESPWRALTLKLRLDNTRAEKRHQELLDMGYQHSYPSFTPHVSLVYRPTDKQIQQVKELESSLRGIPLLFVGEIHEAIQL